MIFKRRWFRILVVVVGLVLFVGYFAFSTFLFAPHESDFEHDVAALVPRDVDFFVAKAGLGRDFGRFPRLAVLDDLEDDPRFESFIESPEWNDFQRDEQGPVQALRDLEQQVRLPLGLDVLDVFGGRDLALAGRFQGSELSDADWAAYGRVGWAGKLGFALLKRGWLGLDAQGIAIERESGMLKLSGGQLARPIYLTRIRDVVVAGTSHELASAAVDLAAQRGKGSLLASADYNDNIATVRRHARRDEIEVIVDMRDLLGNLDHQGPWPDTRSQEFLPAFLGRVFQAPSCKKMMGVIGFHDGIQLDLYGGFASETITADQRSIYLRRGFGKDEVLTDIARLAPADSALFVYLQGPIDVLLKQIFASMEPAMRANIESSFQQTGEYDSLDQLVDHLGGGLYDRLALIVRENSYPEEPDGPPHDEQPVFLISLVTWFEGDGKRIEDLRQMIGNNPGIFGLQGKNGEHGYYTNVVGGNSIHEFWNRLVPGTGIIATFNRDNRCYVFNNHQASGHLSKTYTQGEAQDFPRLSERLDFQFLLDQSLESANLLVWFNPRTAAPTLRKQAEFNAELDAQSSLVDSPIWNQMRPQVESEVLTENFPGKTRRQLDEDDQMRFESLVNREFARRRREKVRELAPQLQAKAERRITWAESMRVGLLMLQLDPREFRVSLRVIAPVEE